MQFGITTSKIDEIGLITRAENLGYDFCCMKVAISRRSCEVFAIFPLVDVGLVNELSAVFAVLTVQQLRRFAIIFVEVWTGRRILCVSVCTL